MLWYYIPIDRPLFISRQTCLARSKERTLTPWVTISSCGQPLPKTTRGGVLFTIRSTRKIRYVLLNQILLGIFRYSLKFIFLLIFYFFFFTNIEFDDYWLLKSSLRNTLQWDLTWQLFLIRKKLINKIIWKNIMESKIKEYFMILYYVNNMKHNHNITFSLSLDSTTVNFWFTLKCGQIILV